MFSSTATFLVRLWPQSAPSKRDRWVTAFGNYNSFASLCPRALENDT